MSVLYLSWNPCPVKCSHFILMIICVYALKYRYIIILTDYIMAVKNGPVQRIHFHPHYAFSLTVCYIASSSFPNRIQLLGLPRKIVKKSLGHRHLFSSTAVRLSFSSTNNSLRCTLETGTENWEGWVLGHFSVFLLLGCQLDVIIISF